jgi:hypothetical protein
MNSRKAVAVTRVRLGLGVTSAQQFRNGGMSPRFASEFLLICAYTSLQFPTNELGLPFTRAPPEPRLALCRSLVCGPGLTRSPMRAC